MERSMMMPPGKRADGLPEIERSNHGENQRTNNKNHHVNIFTTKKTTPDKCNFLWLIWICVVFFMIHQIMFQGPLINISSSSSLDIHSSYLYWQPTTATNVTSTTTRTTSAGVQSTSRSDNLLTNSNSEDAGNNKHNVQFDSIPLESFGYPKSRIPLEDLNFCDIGYGGMQRAESAHFYGPVLCKTLTSLDNENDPTCRSCLTSDSIEQGDAVWDVYSDDNNARKRRSEMDDALQPDLVVVIMSNELYLHMAKNWFCQAYKHGLKPRSVLMYAMDDPTANWAKSEGIYVVHPSSYNIQKTRSESAFKWSLFPLLADLMHINRHVLFNDVDMLWTSNLSQNIHQLWPDIHLVSQHAPRDDALGPLNSGLLSLRPTRQMIVFVETMMSTIPIFVSKLQGRHGDTDQIMWNHLLRHYKFMTLPFRTLPGELVVNAGWDKELKSLTNQTWCIHWVGKKASGKSEYYSALTQRCN